MPSTINGIGTTYFGKKNIFLRQDNCPHCGRHATLTSFDTQLFFAVLFIPIIPLGKKRILDMCSSCSRHRAMPLAQWNTARSQAMDEAQIKLRQLPTDAKTAHDFLAACTAFQNRDAFEQGARDIRRNHAGNADVLNHLAAAYHNFAMWPEAEDAGRAAMKAAETPESREFLAFTLIKQGKADDAAYYLSHLYSAAQAQKVGYLFLLAEAFQAQGDHRKALQTLDQCAGAIPGLAQNKEFKKLRKISEKNRDSRKQIKHQSLAAGNVRIKSGSSASGMIAVVIGPLIVLTLLGLYLFMAYKKGEEREVYLANGLSKAYRVRVAGQVYSLPPMRATAITVKEGDVTVEVAEENLPIESQTAVIKTSFFARPFLDRTFILNPDHTAPILYEKIYYVQEGKENSADLPENERNYHVGEFLYEFKSLDYEFTDFPDEIKMSSGSRTEARDRVALMSADRSFGGSIMLALMISDQKDKALALARRRLELEPDQTDFLSYLSRVMKPDEFLTFVKPGLAARPLRVNWHRIYQNEIGKSNPSHDLAAEYKALLDAEPDNKDLRYLYGRSLDDPAATLAEYRAAAAEPGPSIFGLGALAYRLVSQGNFADAVPFAESAYALDPKNDVVLGTMHHALLGSGQHEKLLTFISEQQRQNPRSLTWFTEQVTLEAALGKNDKVVETARRAARSVTGNDSSADNRNYIENMMLSSAAYVTGDFQTYAKLKDGDDPETTSLHVAMTLGQVDHAADIVGFYIEDEEADWQDCLLVYMALMEKGEAARAATFLKTACDILKEGEKQERQAAAWLLGETTPTPAELEAHPQRLHEKVILIAALGEALPARRAECFALARKINIVREYPWHFINSVTAAATPGGN